MNQKNIAMALIFIFIFTGCSSNKFIEISDSSDCQTTLEGNFYSPPIYKYYAPAILFPKTDKVWIRYGKVIKKDDKGVLFLEKKNGWLDSQDTMYFKYDEIRAIVDSNKYCVWGKLNDNENGGLYIKATLNYLEDPKYAPIYLELTPGKNFAYCVRPGKYEITNIILSYQNENKDIYYSSYSDKIAKLEVKTGVANYIGDIKLINDNNADTDSVSLIIPYKEQSKGTSAAAVGGLLGGAIGGAIAGAITGAANASADSAGVFKFNIEYSQGFKSKTKNKVEKTVLVPFK